MQLEGRNALGAYALVPARRKNMRRVAIQAHDALGVGGIGRRRGTTRTRMVDRIRCGGLAEVSP
jgi:hypothetical protein